MAKAKKVWRCGKCSKRFSGPFALGQHYKQAPSHRTAESKQRREKNLRHRQKKNGEVKKVQRKPAATPTPVLCSYCTQCGQKIGAGWVYCGGCGSEVPKAA